MPSLGCNLKILPAKNEGVKRGINRFASTESQIQQRMIVQNFEFVNI
jgi:hypothetical protein